jgi:very-short-patch-repair endonuclease
MDLADNDNLHHYNGKLQSYANKNRKNMTKAEACIWKYVLGSKQMMGYQFRRQRPVLNYIADFMCKELMLIIEVDGITHLWEEVSKKDITRENDLIKVGFNILRFSDNEVLSDINNVIRVIESYIYDFKGKSKS